MQRNVMLLQMFQTLYLSVDSFATMNGAVFFCVFCSTELQFDLLCWFFRVQIICHFVTIYLRLIFYGFNFCCCCCCSSFLPNRMKATVKMTLKREFKRQKRTEKFLYLNHIIKKGHHKYENYARV